MKQVGLILSLLLFSVMAHSTSGIPEVTIKYSSLWDSTCSIFKGYEIKDAWKEELINKKNELEADWKKYGGKLLLTTVTIVGKEFKRTSITAHLTLCNTPSRSFPIIVNMRYALSGFIDPPVQMHVKTGTLYHEILHKYIDDNLPESSKLIEKYKNEHSRVLKHVHLLALQKAVYLKLQLNDQLSSIMKVDSQLPNGYYKRAWEIVNSHPDYYLEFVHELQAT